MIEIILSETAYDWTDPEQENNDFEELIVWELPFSWEWFSIYDTLDDEEKGQFPIRQDITVLPADDPKKLRLGWVIYEEVGIVVMNDYATSKINVLDANAS